MKGNFLMHYSLGNFGFLSNEKMKNQPLILLDLGIERRENEAYKFDNNARHPYSGYLLQYTLKGQGSFFMHNKEYAVPTGSCFICKIPSHTSYALPTSVAHTSATENYWEFFYLHFDGPAADSFFQTIVKNYGSVFELPMQSSPLHLFFHLFEQCKTNGRLELYEGGEFLYRFFAQTLRELESPTIVGSHALKEAIHYMREHFQTIESIHEVADYCQISHEHLSRIFRKEIEQSPIHYLTNLRIEHALFLLLNTTHSIEEIAIQCGFQNGNYFSKVFKKYLSYSPKEYRKLI